MKNNKLFLEQCKFNKVLLKTLPFGLDIVDAKGNILFLNKRLKSKFGKNAIGKKCWLLYKDNRKQCKRCPLRKGVSVGKTETFESENVFGGKTYLITHTGMKYKDKEAVMEIFQDITERKHLEVKLRSMSLKDDLTKLYNRRGFLELVAQQLKIAERHKKDTGVLFIDLDNMKFINDNFGHREGDVALMTLSVVLKKACRDSDIIARIGGDEFVVFGMGLNRKSSEHLISRIRKELIRYADKKIKLPYVFSVSIGTAYSSPRRPRLIDALIEEADRLMYREKKNKRKMYPLVYGNAH